VYRIAAPFYAIVMMAAGSVARADDTTKYDCQLDYPDGTFGVAVVKVIISDGELAAPTVMVTVD
jgi:hypothetical protein